MKRNIFLICALVLLTSTVFSQSIDIGFGATAGTKMNFGEYEAKTGFGVNAHGMITLSKFGIIGGISYYLPQKSDHFSGEEKRTFVSTNLDLMYSLIKLPKIKIYVLGGLANLTQKTKTTSDGNVTKSSNNNLLFEAGAGLKAGPIYVEAKYQTKIRQFVATVGFNIL